LPYATKNYDVRVIEEWINKSLVEAEYFEIPGTLKKQTGNMSAMQDYGIDRIALNKTGIQN
jgi:hypothetical protein